MKQRLHTGATQAERKEWPQLKAMTGDVGAGQPVRLHPRCWSGLNGAACPTW